jgi:hypothetical protein
MANNIPNFIRIGGSQRYELYDQKQTTLYDASYDTSHEITIANVINQRYIPVVDMTRRETSEYNTRNFNRFLDCKYNRRVVR